MEEILDKKQKNALKIILQNIRNDTSEHMEVGETYILLHSNEDSERKISKCVDEIDGLISEFNLDDRLVAVSQRPPTTRVLDPSSGEEKLKRMKGSVGVGFERIN
jgi:hypothetical protein